MTTTPETPAAAQETAAPELKSLDYYLQHPDEMPADPKVIEQLTSSADDAEPKTEAKATEATAPEQKAQEKQEEKQPILAKDGKSTIPFEVLENERTQRQDAERRAAEVVAQSQAQMQALQQQLEAAQAGKSTDKVDAPLVDAETLNAMRDEFPLLAKVFDSQQKIIESLTAKLGQLETGFQRGESERQADERSETQKLIDQVPDLKNWQAKAPYLFARAIEIDNQLVQEEWAKKKANPALVLTPDTERFARVAQQVRQEIGLPAADPLNPQKSDFKSEADKVLAQARAPVPNSLSDLTGGAGPAGSELENLNEMSVKQMGEMFLRMNPDQRAAYLSRL